MPRLLVIILLKVPPCLPLELSIADILEWTPPFWSICWCVLSQVWCFNYFLGSFSGSHCDTVLCVCACAAKETSGLSFPLVLFCYNMPICCMLKLSWKLCWKRFVQKQVCSRHALLEDPMNAADVLAQVISSAYPTPSRFLRSEMISGSMPARESSAKGRKVHVTGSFLRSSTDMHALANNHTQKLKTFLTSYYLANFMGIVVLVDAYATCVDIDARAKDPNGSAPEFFLTVSDICLVLYSLEILTLLLVFGRAFLKDWMTVLDAGIVACGWAEKVIASIGNNGLGFRVAVLRALRLVRIFRLMRVLKRIRPLRELHKLVMMMATCFRTLLWSFLLCFVVMTVWAMLMVEMIYPALEDGLCRKCTRAVGLAMDSNTTSRC